MKIGRLSTQLLTRRVSFDFYNGNQSLDLFQAQPRSQIWKPDFPEVVATICRRQWILLLLCRKLWSWIFKRGTVSETSQNWKNVLCFALQAVGIPVSQGDCPWDSGRCLSCPTLRWRAAGSNIPAPHTSQHVADSASGRSGGAYMQDTDMPLVDRSADESLCFHPGKRAIWCWLAFSKSESLALP